MATAKPLEEIMKELPPESRHELEDFASYLWEKRGLKKGKRVEKSYDFNRLYGMALKGPTNPNPRFKDEDDLWKDEPW